MPRFRRQFIAGGTYFFTVVTYRRRPILCRPLARTLLRDAIGACRGLWPFEMPAAVLLPDHLHAIWSLPAADDAYSRRWGWIKQKFTAAWLAAGGEQRRVTTAQRQQRRSGVWQPRIWEHTIRDEQDFERHVDYIHYNPVKHGLAGAPRDWAFSSFHRWVKRGVYAAEWGAAEHAAPRFDDLDETAME
jgi:putative transposase